MPIPVILDTDIGGDIDDTWALALLLRRPALDLRLVVTNTGDTAYRARLAAKLLDVAGRDDVPVAAGEGDGLPAPENNIVMDIPSARSVFAAPWRSRVVTPLDTCGLVRLAGEDYRHVADSPDPLLRAVIENYRIWVAAGGGGDPDAHSSTLYDTVAVHLAESRAGLTVERTGLRVTPDGRTVRDPAATAWDVASAWTDLADPPADSRARSRAHRMT